MEVSVFIVIFVLYLIGPEPLECLLRQIKEQSRIEKNHE